jgi:hypothetical protein
MVCFWAGIPFEAVGPQDGRFFREAGVYAFVRRSGEDAVLLYVDHADSVAGAAYPGHPRWAEALRLGMNELHLCRAARERMDRLLVVDRLVRRCAPLLNLLEDSGESADLRRA